MPVFLYIHFYYILKNRTGLGSLRLVKKEDVFPRGVLKAWRYAFLSKSTKNVCQRPSLRTASWHSLSNIEMAFDVLVHDEEGRDLDVVECEEFIDQCKAYAAELTVEQNRCEHFNSRNAFQDIMNSLPLCFPSGRGRTSALFWGILCEIDWIRCFLRFTLANPCNALSFA